MVLELAIEALIEFGLIVLIVAVVESAIGMAIMFITF